MIEGPQEGQMAKRMRINSQVNQGDIYAITENSIGVEQSAIDINFELQKEQNIKFAKSGEHSHKV